MDIPIEEVIGWKLDSAHHEKGIVGHEKQSTIFKLWIKPDMEDDEDTDEEDDDEEDEPLFIEKSFILDRTDFELGHHEEKLVELFGKPVNFREEINPKKKTKTRSTPKPMINFNKKSQSLSHINSVTNNLGSSQSSDTAISTTPLNISSPNLALPSNKLKETDLMKQEIHCIFDSRKVKGLLTILPHWLIFQADPNDPLVKKEGSVKFQLNYTMNQVISCGMVPKTFLSHIDELQFGMDEERQTSLAESTISSVHSPKGSFAQSIFNLSASMVDRFLDTKDNLSTYNLDGDYPLHDPRNETFIPRHIGGTSTLITPTDCKDIIPDLPIFYQLRDWKLLYQSGRDGISINTLYSKTRDKDNFGCILLIRDSENNVFGGFLSESLRRTDSKSYYGTGECFLFKIKPTYTSYGWTKENECFIQTTEKYISMGGGNNGKYGLWLDEDFHDGGTYRCETYDNDPLSTREDFRCLNVE
eukprot:gene13823-16294_t